MKILILGINGMLGSAFARTFLKNNISFFASVSSKKKKDKINNLLKIPKNKILVLNIMQSHLNGNINKINKLNFDIIINCIGIIKPHINEKNKNSIDNAILINSIFPRFLCDHINKKVKIYQIATDCVFKGDKSFYTENSKHDPEDVYGKTKSLGEVNNKNFFNLRSSIIGKELNSKLSLIEWFLSNKMNSTINGFNNHNWNGLTTDAFAEYLSTIIINNIKIPNLLHVVPSNFISKYKLLKCLKKKYKRNDLTIKSIKTIPKVDRTLSTQYKVLNKKIWSLSNFNKIPKIEEMIDRI